MVLKGQFLERPTLIPVGAEVLEGLSHRGERRPPLLILPPNPEGGMDNVIAAEVAWAVAQAGHPTLRFNFRGVGASQGQPSVDLEPLTDEAEAALELVMQNARANRAAVVAIGGSAPVALALHARRHPEHARPVAGITLISPARIELSALGRVSVDLQLVVGEKDTTHSRSELSAAATWARGSLELIEAADSTFQRSLPQVGKAVVKWLGRL